jgi:ribosomal protein S21
VAAVDLRDGESPEHLITRFRQAVQRDGILREIKQRRHFIPKSERRRIARAKAARRRRRAIIKRAAVA